MRRREVSHDQQRLVLLPLRVQQELAEERGVGGLKEAIFKKRGDTWSGIFWLGGGGFSAYQDGPVGPQSLCARDYRNVRELHPLADGLHHVLDVEQHRGARLEVLKLPPPKKKILGCLVN